MSNLSKFEGFKLEKKKMNAVTGGKRKVVCIGDDGENYYEFYGHPDLNPQQAADILGETYDWLNQVTCR